MSVKALRDFKKEISKQIQGNADNLADNSANNIEDYRFLTGYIAGLKTALLFADDQIKKSSSDDELEDDI